MKKSFLTMAVAAIVAFSMPTDSNAQSLLGSLKNVASQAASKATGSSVVGDIVSNLLGTGKVSEKSLVGTWSYSEPCLVAESENILSGVAATAAASKAKTYMEQGLTKAGFTKGKVKVTFDEKKNVTIVVGSKTVKGTYAINGTDLTIKFLLTKKQVTMNCKLDGGNLQLAMKADRLLTLINNVAASASSASQTLGTVSTLLKSVNGLYVGLEFSKN